MNALTAVIDGLRTPSVNVLRIVLGLVLTDLPYDFVRQDSTLPVYDFVVVGAGAAGSILAARLAETDATVLLLEAGGSATPESSVPGFMPLQVGGDRDWNMRLASQQKAQLGFYENASYLSMGKVVGGGSTIGGMVHARGSRYDYDNWASLGNEGWDYRSVLPYFRKMEDYRGEKTPFEEQYHGRGGPMRVQSKQTLTGVGTSFLRAGLELGYSVIDENADGEIGFSPLHFTIHNGVRDTVAERYLRPNVHKPNLFIRPLALVTKVLFDRRKRAMGVQYMYGDKKLKVHARKEVILCAGVINSPKLLMLSGIGPKEHLEDKGIPVMVPLEGVGQNLKDHHVLLNFPFSSKQGSAFSLMEYISLNNIKQYRHNKTGIYSDQFGEDGAAWLHLGGGSNPEWPDVQLTLLNLALSNFGQLAVTYNSALKKEVYRDVLAPLEGGTSFVIAPMLARPLSSGSVTLRSRDPAADPVIDFNFLDHPDDVALLVKVNRLSHPLTVIPYAFIDVFSREYRHWLEVSYLHHLSNAIPTKTAVRMALAIAKTSAMVDGVEAQFKSQPLQQCRHLPADSDEYWECFCRHLVTTFWHAAGTCKMAPATDPMGVVDHKLNVRGVRGLRVVDASIMPQVTSANNMAATYMIAEKAADMIKLDWRYPVEAI